jgi:hypothetical protein
MEGKMTRLKDANWIIVCPVSKCKGRLILAKDKMALKEVFNAHIKLYHDNNNEVWNLCTIIRGKVLQYLMSQVGDQTWVKS